MTLMPVIAVDLFGLDKLTTAYGILSLLEGVGSLAGTPLIGTFTAQLHRCRSVLNIGRGVKS